MVVMVAAGLCYGMVVVNTCTNLELGPLGLVATVSARVYNVERVSNAPYPYRKHSRESNVIVTRLKTVRNDVSTLIKIGIDRRGLLPPLPQCLQEFLHSEASEKLEWSLRHSS